MMLQNIKQYLDSFAILEQHEIDYFLTLVQYKKIKKNDFLIQEGKIAKDIAFINTGVLRSFYHSASGEEITYCFTFSNSFITAYSSYISQTPSVENIQALTDIECYTISRVEILKLEQSSTNWLRLFKNIAEQTYIYMEKRIFGLQKENAEQRYHNLLTNHPNYIQTIPLRYLASYLGITQRHLSRIRKSLSN